MMVVLMLGVTLLVALAMRNLAVMFSLGESKRDTRGVFVMATEAMATDSPSSSSSSSSLYSSCATNPLGGVFLVKFLLLGKDLALSFWISLPPLSSLFSYGQSATKWLTLPQL